MKTSRIRTVYFDNDVISVYCAGVRAGKEWLELENMLNLAHGRAVKLETSTVSREEGGKGAGSAVRQRARAHRSLHMRIVREPIGNYRRAERIVETHPDRKQHARLLNDARHLLMAISMGSDVLISFNTPDFKDLAEHTRGMGKPPLIVKPAILASILAEGMHPRGEKLDNPPRRPVRRGSLRAFVLRRLRAMNRRLSRGRVR